MNFCRFLLCFVTCTFPLALVSHPSSCLFQFLCSCSGSTRPLSHLLHQVLLCLFAYLACFSSCSCSLTLCVCVCVCARVRACVFMCVCILCVYSVCVCPLGSICLPHTSEILVINVSIDLYPDYLQADTHTHTHTHTHTKQRISIYKTIACQS